jgi:hypothetical protein
MGSIRQESEQGRRNDKEWEVVYEVSHRENYHTKKGGGKREGVKTFKRSLKRMLHITLFTNSLDYLPSTSRVLDRHQ